MKQHRFSSDHLKGICVTFPRCAKWAPSTRTNCFFTLNWKGLVCKTSFPRAYCQFSRD